jgi:TonB family protein
MSQIIFNSVKQSFHFYLVLLTFNISCFCQIPNEASSYRVIMPIKNNASTNKSYPSIKLIVPLKNNSFSIMEFTLDSLLIYKGTLSSVEPETRDGKFYFYNSKGAVIVTGTYFQDIPYGKWVYYNEKNDTVKVIDYSAVWNYLEIGAFDYYIDSTEINSLKNRDKKSMNADGTFYSAQVMPRFNHGNHEFEFNKYIYTNLIYPIYPARRFTKQEVNVQFIIDSKGKIRNPQITDSEISDFNIEIMRVLSESPVWEPGYQNNIPINLRMNWVIDFFYVYSTKPDRLEFEYNADIAGDMPTFNGGDPATEFRKFISNNLRYPEKAAVNRISGRVIVQFTINTDGKVVNAIIISSLCPEIDQEALRVVNSSPPWTPGSKDGKPVDVNFTFPINFELQ